MFNSSKRKVFLIYIFRDYLERTREPAQRNRRIVPPDDDIYTEVDDYAVQTDEFVDDNRLPSSIEYYPRILTPAESKYYRAPAESEYDNLSEDEESFYDNESVAAEETAEDDQERKEERNIYEFMYSSEYQSTISNGKVVYNITCTCYASSDCIIQSIVRSE